MEHIKLITIKRQLQAKMNYPTEPDPWGEYMCLDEAFDELLTSFQRWLVLTHRGSPASITEAKSRGWMTDRLADMFTDYCIKGWKVV